MLSVKGGGGGAAKGRYAWNKLDAKGGNFIDYVVANDEGKYPDGGEQGGFWYERVVEGVAGIEIIPITLSAETAPITVNHTVKGAKRAVLLPAGTTYSQYQIVMGYIANETIASFGTSNYKGLNIHKYDILSMLSSVTLTDTKAVFPSTNCYGNSRKFAPGKYICIVSAT